MTDSFDAIVIGAGEAGAVIASRAVAAGRRVAMVYREPYGSTCVNVGCVPSKFMLHRARVAQTIRTAARFHIGASAPTVDLPAIVAEKRAMIQGHRDEGLGNALAADGLTLIEGEACFRGPRQVEVGGRVLSADHVFIATGMRPAVPSIEGLEGVPYYTNETIMDVETVPERLIVLGGGYIGCELGQAYRRFGADVTIVHSGSAVCPGEERDASTLVARGLRADGIDLHLRERAIRAQDTAGGVAVTTRTADGSEQVLEGTHLLVATGRRASTDGLDLAAAGVSVRDDGSIPVDDRMATNVAGVWAAGDVNGEQPFTRVCQEEGKIAYANAFEDADARIDRRSLAHAVFTDPELASVGLTEAQARAAGHDVAAGLVTFDKVEKAELIGETTGLIKFVVDAGSRVLLGAHVVGPSAGDLVYAASAVIRRGGALDELATTVGIFPTLAEGIEGAARGLVRRIAPERVAGPLVAHGDAVAAVSDESGANFACPACAGEFETTVRLDGSGDKEHEDMGHDFTCPACGADFEVQDSLAERDEEDGAEAEATCPNCGTAVSAVAGDGANEVRDA